VVPVPRNYSCTTHNLGPSRTCRKEGGIDESFTLNVDLAPTILSAVGIKVPSVKQGRDMSDLSLERASEPWRQEFYYEHISQQSIRASTALVRHDFNYIGFPGTSFQQLFDLKRDSLELKDLVSSANHTQLVVEMKQRHDEDKHFQVVGLVYSAILAGMHSIASSLQRMIGTGRAAEPGQIDCPVWAFRRAQ
jgi:arylsulfatase A-like enzyme